MFRISTRAWTRSIIEHTGNCSRATRVVSLQCPAQRSQRAPPPPKPARTLDDLPRPSTRRVPQGSASQRRAAMTQKRHDYARQVLAAEITRREAGKARQQEELQRVQQAKTRSPDTADATDAKEATTTFDPHHPEAILNVPKGVFSPATGIPLRQPKRIDIDTSEKRRSRRLVRMARQSRIRSEALVELFHRSADFGRERLDQLKRVLDGTSVNGKVGIEAVNDWQKRESQTAASSVNDMNQ
ncbi:hypothetical protein BDF22DRAFT_701128 [Syncephalis plumigaleata]|nr:hypothetical protein BDF22DRAFT_701128 [Syncephalis plumigaleata]